MTYLEGPLVVITSPAVARWLEATTSLWLQKYRECGCPEGPPPEWMFTVQSELHALGTDGNKTVSEKSRSGSLSVNETAKRLQVSRQMVTRYCRQGRLVATRRGKVWQIDPRSLDEMEKRRA